MEKINKYVTNAYFFSVIVMLIGSGLKSDHDTYMINFEIFYTGVLVFMIGKNLLRKKSEPIIPDASHEILQDKSEQVIMIRTIRKKLDQIQVIFLLSVTIFCSVQIIMLYLHLDIYILFFLIMIVILISGLVQFILSQKLLKVKEDLDEQPSLENLKIEKPIGHRMLYSLDLMLIILVCIDIFLYLNQRMNLFDDANFGFGLLNSLLIIVVVPIRIWGEWKRQNDQNA